jgi:hypothetical protein
VRLPASPEFRDGERVQVKSLLIVPWSKAPTTRIRIVDQDYDSVVYFDEDFDVTDARRFARPVVEEAFTPRARDGARIIRLSRKFLARPDVCRLQISDEMLDRRLPR